MALRLYNTLSAKLEEFHPLENNEVRMYACGPTVYDYVHIGNLRTVVAVDMLRRFLLQSGYRVRHVMNITDVDDKIIRNAAPEGLERQAIHRQVRESLSRRRRHSEHSAADPGARHRSHPEDGASSSPPW